MLMVLVNVLFHARLAKIVLICVKVVQMMVVLTNLGALPSISFKAGSNALSDDAKAVLATVAARLRNNPECKVVVIGYCASR